MIWHLIGKLVHALVFLYASGVVFLYDFKKEKPRSNFL